MSLLFRYVYYYNYFVYSIANINIDNFSDEDLDILWDNEPLTWHYIGEDYKIYQGQNISQIYFRSWPSDLYADFPLKGPNRIKDKLEPRSEITVYRTVLIFMIRGTDWDIDFEPTKWKEEKIGDFLGGTQKSAIYSRILLPGNYTMGPNSLYLVADKGNVLFNYIIDLISSLNTTNL